MPSYGETIDRLNQVHIEDNGEPLVKVLQLCPSIRFASEHPRFPGKMRTCWARKSVADMLCMAEAYLPDGLHLEIQDAYRSVRSQQVLFRTLCEEMKGRHPEWTERELLDYTNEFVASPYMPAPPPHTTGGAVDVTLVDESGEQIDMTSPHEWDETSSPTNYPGLSPQARSNRRILITAMSRAGFSNYMGEWWHWSYGDSAWAVRIGIRRAIYGQINEPPFDANSPDRGTG